MRNIKVRCGDRVRLVFLGLILITFTPSVISQGCAIEGHPGTVINIYDVSLQDYPDQIGEVYIMQNALGINEVDIEGMTEEYFQATLNDDNLIIHTTDNFGTYREKEVEVEVNLRIQFRCSVTGGAERDTNFFFTIYLLATNDNAPTFPNTEYQLTIPLPLPANFELTLFGEIFARDIDLNDNQVTFAGGNNYFAVGTIGQNEQRPKEYYMSLKTTRQILFLPDDALTLVATATDVGDLTGQATITLVIDPENTYNRDPSPTFESPSYKFRVDENGNYINNYCYVTENSYDETEISFTLQGTDVAHFVIDREDRAISVVFASTYTEEEFGDRTYLTVNLIATRPGYDNGIAAIIVDLPVVCVVEEPEVTTPAPCEITTCPDDEGPVFSKKVYTYRIFEGTSGVIGQVEATIDNEEYLDTLRYRLNYNDAPPLTLDVVVIDEVTGSFSIVDLTSLTETSFNIEVLATVELEETTLVGNARIVVVIDANDKCSDTPVSKSLTFVTVREEQANTDIFPMKEGDCEYELLSFTPNDKDYLIVNENQQLCTSAVDRESESFGMMTHPQIQAKLKLICPEEDEEGVNLRKRRAIEDFRDNIFTDEIPFNSDILTLNVLIEDINDNAPVFESPPASLTEIGYPDADLVGLLLPPYLIKIKANDADIGDNAKITYGLSTNNYFGIDSQSGVIYPKTTELGSDVLSLQVTASDGVHNPSVTLNVHKLTLDHLVVIYVDNYGSHEVEEVENYLKSQLGTSLNILKYGNVPGESKIKSSGRTTSGTNLKLVVYAFESDSQPTSATRLIEKLEQIEGTSSYAFTSGMLKDEITVIQDLESDSTVFVAVIITLAVLVVILLGGGFVAWWFWIRPTEWKHVEESRSNSLENVQAEFAEIQEKKEEPRPSVTLRDNTWTESTDSTTPQIIKNATAMEGNIEKSPDPTPSLRERKKSITFNENVERIEIEAEVPVTVSSYQF